MSKIIGIDLGTTNSVVAVLSGGEPEVITTSEGQRLLPSVVSYNKNKEQLVGFIAKRQSVINYQNTIYSIKRFMGRRYDEVLNEKKSVSFEVIEGKGDDILVKIPVMNKEYTPQEISSVILSKLKQDAESFLGEKVTQAVITVPAYFNDSQRQATKDAGKIAGLEVLRIINEPTAAALAYGMDKKKDEKILVFDLGGGTYDVSVLEVGEGVFEVKATNGDTHLGGDNWDETIVNWLVDEFKKQNSIDLSKDKQALQRLREAAEKAKIELSSTFETEINLPYITATSDGPLHLQIKLTRSKLEQLTEDLMKRAIIPLENVLKDSGLSISQIDEVILVGGSTRMPMVQELIKKHFGKEPNKTVNPDEVVAMGAALQGGVLSGEVRDLLLLDVVPLSLGLETMGGIMTRLVERNSTIPIRKTETFSTAADGQTSVDIHVLQGERPMASDNISLGNFRLDGIPTAPRGVPQIEVIFNIDANGILNVTAKDKVTQKEQSVNITASTNLSKADVDRLTKEASLNESTDRKQKELIEARNSLENLTYTVEKELSKSGNVNHYPSMDKALQQAKTMLNSTDINAINVTLNLIKSEYQKYLSEVSMQGSASQQSVNKESQDDHHDQDPEIIEGTVVE